MKLWWYGSDVLLLLALACTLKDGHDGLVNGTLGDDSAAPDTPTDTAVPVVPTSTCVDGAAISFTPAPVQAAAPLTVVVTAQTNYVWVGLSFEGPDTALIGDVEASGTGPWSWTTEVDGLTRGEWDVRFSADTGATVVCTATVPVY